MRRRTSRRVMWAVLLLLALGLVLPPYINVNRYRNRVTGAVSRALGRPVTVSSIELKLLPRPGLVLYNFVVTDDPAFGAEPMLRADTVTAYLRLTSLWRGRLEIGTLDLDNPSLNLVRRADGHWNMEELVERASQANTAPTAKTRPEARPRFPYVEASGGRINFKLGEVKKAFAFTNADFALWLESENLWSLRVRAQPVRTDVNISDTGTLKLDGRFQRAASLRDTPIYLKLNFSEGPLGQLTKLFYGRDRGWRGQVRASALLSGTPASLGITMDARADDFRRYDIALGESLRLQVHCTGTYSSAGDALYDVRCESPVGSTGVLRLRGDSHGWGPSGGYEWNISGEKIPAERIAAFARHAKKDLPSDLTASGEVEANFTVRKSPGGIPQWSGGGRTIAFTLQADVLQHDLPLGEVHFAVPDEGSMLRSGSAKKASLSAISTESSEARARLIIASPIRQGRSVSARATPRVKRKVSRQSSPPAVAGFQLVIEPFALPLGAPSPATASGAFDRDRYSLHVSGGAELGRLLNVAQALGIGTPGVGLAGVGQIDIDVAGAWMGFTAPAPEGTVQVRNATAELQGVSEPLLVRSASVLLANQMVEITSFSAAFSKGAQLSGSASFPIHCTGPENCVLNFDVRTEDASLAVLDQLLNPAFSRQPWYHLLAIGKQHPDALMKLHASGHWSAPHFALGSLTINNVDATLELSAGKLRIHEIRADLLGGHQDGSWLADFTVSPPRFMGNGIVSKLSISQLASLMHDNWAVGAVNAEYSLSLSGLSAAQLASSATGTANFTWSGGLLRHVSLDSRGTPVAFSKFSGKISLQDGTFTLLDCKLQSNGGSYAVNGTALYDRTLNLKLARSGGQSYAISGTLDQPHVETVASPAAEAALH
ncbi:MAG TPA: AsmA family protein [Terriglobales bacterium]|nr:AsmA family protein [Terriglobales bacterium]